MTAHHPTESDALRAARADADSERARADAAEGVSRLQAASLAELARLAEDVRCLVADLTDDAHSSQPIPPDRLRRFTAQLNERADTLARAATGYADARATDMAYPSIHADLDAHGWTPRPDRDLDGTLPPIPITELSDRRGYRRGWQRGAEWITLWFTGPHGLAYAESSRYGRLCEAREVRAVITSPPHGAADQDEPATTRPATAAIPFDATFEQVAEHMRAAGWGSPAEVYRCDARGKRRANGSRTCAVWRRPSNPAAQLSVWGRQGEPAQVRYWAGPVVDLATLSRITESR